MPAYRKPEISASHWRAGGRRDRPEQRVEKYRGGRIFGRQPRWQFEASFKVEFVRPTPPRKNRLRIRRRLQPLLLLPPVPPPRPASARGQGTAPARPLPFLAALISVPPGPITSSSGCGATTRSRVSQKGLPETGARNLAQMPHRCDQLSRSSFEVMQRQASSGAPIYTPCGP